MWTQAEAITLCRQIEDICPAFDCHVALTGGCLYKDGPRKDADLLFYRVRQAETVNMAGLFAALETLGLQVLHDFGWCVKARYGGEPVDLFFPDRDGLDYPEHPAPVALPDDLFEEVGQ